MNRTKLLVPLLLLAGLSTCYAQTKYEINIDRPDIQIHRGQLDLGGRDPEGDSISVNNFYIEYNHKPFFMISGEFHYSRYPHKYWEEAIRKMKAGGINTIATYVFWNMHEPHEGEFDWTGDLNLRRFIELCAKNDIWVILRIGPFAHGAVRNGGLPDWLYGRPFDVRSNDPQYLSYVEKLYDQIGEQVEGLLFKDGGPVIAVQLENEYQHSAAQWAYTYHDSPPEYTVAAHDEKITMKGVGISKKENKYADYGKDHMKVLKRLAEEAGLKVPIYTATGWGRAAIIKNGSLPVTAAYPYPTWAALKPSSFYLYKDIHRHPDYAPVSYQAENYPSLPAEIGAGVMESYNRRPFVPPQSMAPLIVRTVGSGSNGIGYYVYHGGSTPYMNGKFYSDISLPRISHEHQSPIGEFGELKSSYYDLKLIHYFLNSYGGDLAPMTTFLPKTNDEISPNNTSMLRYAVWARKESGFLFMHNFQDHLETKDLKDLQISIKTAEGEVRIPEDGSFTLKENSWAILPFNTDLDGVDLKYATTQPLVKWQDGETYHYVFFSSEGLSPEFAIRSKSYENIESRNCRVSNQKGITYIRGEPKAIFSFNMSRNGEQHKFLVVPKDFALKSWFFQDGAHKELVFSPATVMKKKDGTFELVSRQAEDIPVYVYGNRKKLTVEGAKVSEINAPFSELSGFSINFDPVKPPVHMQQVDSRHWILRLEKDNRAKLSSINDIFMTIDYEGDMVQAFIDGKMVADDLYLGKPWVIGLKKFFTELASHEMYFYFHPLYPDAPFYSDFSKDMIPDFSRTKTYLNVKSIDVSPQYKAYFSIKK